MTGVLVLRPQPGADETAARARALGFAAHVAPLFTVHAVAWQAPAGPFDAVMLTSANAARQASDGLTPFLDLPCYAVGPASAGAARAAGFSEVRTGPANGAALAAMMAGDGVAAALHPCGADRIAIDQPGLRIADVAVYAAEAVATLPAEAEAALRAGAVALLHSPRAASLFAALAAPDRPRIRIVAISDAVAQAAGTGWAALGVAAQPRDEALLELAAKLCQSGDPK